MRMPTVWRRLHPTIALIALLVGCASVGHASPPAAPAAVGLTLTVDLSANRIPISPLIYGMNTVGLSDGEHTALTDALRLPIARWGGNAVTRYNWQNDFYNTGSDWYFENILSDNPDRSQLPTNSAADRFVRRNRDSAVATLLTVPLIGYVAKASDLPYLHPFACGFKVDTYGIQQSTDPYDTTCGNGVAAAGNPYFPIPGTRITGNNPADTSVAVGPSFVQSWIAHLIDQFGGADAGGVRFYGLDNEPGLWPETHRDIFPNRLTYAELRDRGYQYAAAIKAADPAAQVLGPDQDGWTRYFYSSYGNYPDTDAQNERNSYGGMPFVAWYLQQMQAYEQQNGVRLLDYLDLHYYPQAPGVALSPAGNAATQALRLRSTRALWDPSYVDESWIKDTEEGNTAVQLIPRMRAWRDQYYPGTKLAITEYNWGALDDINGALAQADVLGIFGREGVDLATIWSPPTSTQPGAFAFRMYRNYDGSGGAFGDLGLAATSADQGRLAIYAAQRGSDGALTIMVINKSGSPEDATMTLAGSLQSGQARVYRYSSANPGAIVREADQPYGALSTNTSGFSTTLPASSITLFVIPAQLAYLPLVQR